jgi:phosphoglycolate phosphatase-like HAD superfamily hydrolase
MNRPRHFTQDHLRNLTPRFPTFVGVDSDGCLFPTMDIKQKQCFHPLLISLWKLEPVEKALREAAEFVNLNSVYRGQNRFLSLLRTFDLLRDHPDVRRSGFPPPPTGALRAFCESGVPLGNATLQARVEATRDPELQRILDWSLAVNAEVERNARNIAPFHWVIESLEAIRGHSDAICVSQTPEEALIREWEEHDLVKYVRVIAGQELGTKADHLALATRDRYQPDRVLMIGDAQGDWKAAQAVNARFFPINPGHEEDSWKQFLHEAYPRFLDNQYDPGYEAGLVERFNALLPETPPWMNAT